MIETSSFLTMFAAEISTLFSAHSKRYSIQLEEFALALKTTTSKYLLKSATDISRKEVLDFFAQLNVAELLLALACAQGDEQAWRDFMGEYRPFLQSLARQIAKNETVAEELVEMAYTQLYGLREVEGKRVSKFAAYSGRGSLKGWLRAVIFQLSVDHHRSQNRFVQPEEEQQLERLSPAVAPTSPESINSSKYQNATEQALKQALKQLDSRLKLVLSYYYYDNWTLKQIGQLFGVHEATASRWLQKAQQDVRQLVEKFLYTEYGFNSYQIKECFAYAAQGDTDIGSMLANSPQNDRAP